MDSVVNDVNGDFYVAGQQGELEEDKSHRHFIIPIADQAAFTLGTKPDASNAAIGVSLKRVVRANFWFLRSLVNPITVADAMKVVWLRLLGLMLGFADLGNTNGTYNLLYNDTKVVDIGAQTTAGDETTRLFATRDATGAAANVHPYTHDIPNWDEAGNADWRMATRLKFSNILCIIAFFMRTRAHHWLDDFNSRYIAIWRKCLYEEDNIGLSWELVAHHALHYIYPHILDNFWTECVANERCAGALIKRYHSYAAGMAAVGAVWAGYRDLIIIFPGFAKTVVEAVAELKRCSNEVLNDRWAGSVNRRYYNAPEVGVNESLLASLAATIISALNASGSSHALAKSDALKRVASGAPITGNFMANVITKASQHDDMVYAILPEVES